MFPNLVSLGPLHIRSFSVAVIIAFILGSFVFWKRAKEEHYDEAKIFDLTLGTLALSLLGGRLLYIALNFSDFGVNLLYWLSFWSMPGFYWLGFYLTGIIYFVKFCQREKWNVFKTLDLAVIGLSFSYIWLGIGFFLGGGLVGRTTQLPIGLTLPGTYEPTHPVGVYSTLYWLLVFMFLWWVEGKYRRFVWYQRFKGDSKEGFLFFSFLVADGVWGVIHSLVGNSIAVVYGVDLTLIFKVMLLCTGVAGIVLRSGIVTRLGIESWFTLKK